MQILETSIGKSKYSIFSVLSNTPGDPVRRRFAIKVPLFSSELSGRMNRSVKDLGLGFVLLDDFRSRSFFSLDNSQVTIWVG